MTIKNLVLGGGYVGQRLADRIDAPTTHRSEEKARRNTRFISISPTAAVGIIFRAAKT
nr:hypothetical protein [Methylomarinum sp. Ch1-1]MDP4521901.1 hypothetical protein [Methylomarinum sp. Ch1-1]MDP4521928.1 hypothetical protein [Methylomarinum sp. Ch1-1]